MSDALFVLATSYRSVYGALGSAVAARLAPDRPMQHALALGVVGLVACLAGAVASRNAPELGPRWYPIALVVLALPCAWAGGKLHELRARRRAA
jgi:peptidoglycan/LPS O-acetylase OafA/YrhL